MNLSIFLKTIYLEKFDSSITFAFLRFMLSSFLKNISAKVPTVVKTHRL